MNIVDKTDQIPRLHPARLPVPVLYTLVGRYLCCDVLTSARLSRSVKKYSYLFIQYHILHFQGAKAQPWWLSHFLVSERVLFGTWDGVFTSCLVNIFGVIVFLRSGWIVGEAGIGHAG